MRAALVDAAKLDRVRALIAGRVFHSLDLGLPLDALDAERIREAHALLSELTAPHADTSDDVARLRAMQEAAE